MTERPLCRDVSLAAASECLVDAATHLRCALGDLRDAAGHALIATFRGPTMRAVERPMPEPSAEAEARFAEMMARAREAMAQRDAMEPVCVCGDVPVIAGEPCVACSIEATL